MKPIKASFVVAVMLGIVALSGCASTHEDVAEHHHHEKAQFEGKCAYSVENGKFNVEGNPDFKLNHNGVTYFFSSTEARDKFNSHITESTKRANASWERRGGR